MTQPRTDWLAEQFENNRTHLRAVAYRMLGSLPEADDAVQEAWLRLSRSKADAVDNLGGWLTTVVGRICLDMLRSRKQRREDALDDHAEPVAGRASGERDPEQETLLANSVGLALLVVLETLDPAERLAFVLHEMFAMPFEEIAPIVGRSTEAARQLASRARRRLHGSKSIPEADLARQRTVVDAFLTAARGGDFDALVELLDPDVVLRSDARASTPRGTPTEYRDRELIAKLAMTGGARAAQAALIDGEVGVVVAPRGKLLIVLRFTVANGRIAEMEAIAEPDRLAGLEIAVLPA
jgi:RNA polymerase sigma-70 factor (ECF subfamily)